MSRQVVMSHSCLILPTRNSNHQEVWTTMVSTSASIQLECPAHPCRGPAAVCLAHRPQVLSQTSLARPGGSARLQRCRAPHQLHTGAAHDISIFVRVSDPQLGLVQHILVTWSVLGGAFSVWTQTSITCSVVSGWVGSCDKEVPNCPALCQMRG